MFEENKTCPYTGLRPFSEEESLYFKGRDEHIEQATRQLGKNKFLILTGASGDGKSSLVYAGIVPNARAGFLKSTYSNWAVADFRPERNPFHNLCRSIAHQLGIPNVETVKSELSHGFSALVDLYKASPLYYDEQDQVSRDSDDQGKTLLKRKAANLLILADQFEEFFTNPENYQRGVPSVEATLVTNLLLETAQLALEQNLPIYVVITMRSDFIGQCAAFRGLPEYIGFSQFFVPRLNRRQLQEVIEEPARFNADRISRRLTERLIHDMVEGTDQLPILQHALNQIWKMAQDGKEEMDLIHYAMVGGMEGKALPPEDAEKFSRWFDGLPAKIRNCYDSPDLQNVLNTHANKLFYQASDYVREKRNKEVSEADAQSIIETAFKCLTKIDNGRAVRNRMTLAEITAILNNPNIDSGTVQGVLAIFREPGNTLLKPYITDDPETQELKEDAILDITHESLIRNWEHLGEWAAEEYSNYSTFLDFEQQLNRWITSGKSSAFVLYIGPLTYFESWFVKAKPNAPWIARYLEEEWAADLKLATAETTLADSNEFLRRSARKHVVTRTVMRYGPRRIAAVLGLIAVLVLSSFTVMNYLGQRESYVLGQIKEQVLTLAGNPKVTLSSRLEAIIQELELGQTTVKEFVARIPDPLEKINVATGIGANLSILSQTADVPSDEIKACLGTSDSLLALYTAPPTDLASLTRLLQEVNDLAAVLEVRYYYSRDPWVDQLRMKNATRAGLLAKYILTRQPAGFEATTELNTALENGLNHAAFSVAETRELISILSPFENPKGNDWLSKTYGRSKLERRGAFDVYGPWFNGRYQQLAYLYAASGDVELALKCVDTLLFYNQNYHQHDYHNIADNQTNIAVYFYLYQHPEKLDPFVKGYCLKKGIPEEEFYDRLLARCKATFLTFATVESFSRFQNLYHNTNVEFGSDEQVKFFFEKYREVVNRTTTAPAKDFYLSLSYKNEGIIQTKRREDAGLKRDSSAVRILFDEAFTHFRRVPSGYLEEPLTFFDNAYPRKTLFKFPDVITWFHPWEPRGYFTPYASDVFLDYVLREGLFEELCGKENELANMEYWINEDNTGRVFTWVVGYLKTDLTVLKQLETKLLEKEGTKTLDLNWLYLPLANESFRSGDTAQAIVEIDRIQTKALNPYIRSALFPQAYFTQVATAVVDLLSINQTARANELIKSFPNPANRATLYAFAAKEMPGSTLFATLLDSCRKEIDRDETHNNVPRIQLAYALSMRGTENDLLEANRVMKNIGTKSPGLQRMCRSMSYRGALYDAWQLIPENVSDNDRSSYLAETLFGRSLVQKNPSPFWKKYEEHRWKWLIENLLYTL